jgi:hypothetical protein
MTTLKSGTCPQCNSTDVYTNAGKPKIGDRMVVAVTGWRHYSLDTYICCNCSHFEEHIPEKEFKDPKVMEKIRKMWKKVG